MGFKVKKAFSPDCRFLSVRTQNEDFQSLEAFVSGGGGASQLTTDFTQNLHPRWERAVGRGSSESGRQTLLVNTLNYI